MPKFTVIDGTFPPKVDDSASIIKPHTAEEALTVLRDFLSISDPIVQQAVADLVATLARLSV